MHSSLNFPNGFIPTNVLGIGSHAKIIEYETYNGFKCAGKHQNISRSSQIETEALKNIKNERVIAFYDEYIRENNEQIRHIILMEICDMDLMSYIKRVSPVYIQNPASFRSIAAQLIEGVLAIHNAGFFHGDISPSNILIKGKNIKICDFGCAWRVDEHPIGPIGRYGYEAPESLLGIPIDPKVDIWGLGCVLYFIATCGENPFIEIGEKNRALYMREIGYRIGFPEKFASLASRYAGHVSVGSKPSPFPHLKQIIGNLNWHLINACLRCDPDERSTALELYNHETFNYFFHDALIPFPKKQEQFFMDYEDRIRQKLKKEFDANLL